MARNIAWNVRLADLDFSEVIPFPESLKTPKNPFSFTEGLANAICEFLQKNP